MSPSVQSNPTHASITALLLRLRNGSPEAAAELAPFVYPELHRLAVRYMSRERKNHTLQPTALVNEAYLRLLKRDGLEWQNRAHFFAVASQLMRHILVDHARLKNAQKRGAGFQVTLNDDVAAAGETNMDLVALDEALKRLAAVDDRQSRIVEMHFFGGLSMDEIAAVLRISARTVKRDWHIARTWLYGELTRR